MKKTKHEMGVGQTTLAVWSERSPLGEVTVGLRPRIRIGSNNTNFGQIS